MRRANQMPPVHRLRDLFVYDPTTGSLLNRIGRRAAKAGHEAGGIDGKGYRRVAVDGRRHRGHRICWAMYYGEPPPDDLHMDHKNGIRDDNRIDNLRLATIAENGQNLAARENRNGLTGAVRQGGRWQAQIKFRGRVHYLGLFATPEEAHAAYLAAKQKMHTFQPTPRGAE